MKKFLIIFLLSLTLFSFHAHDSFGAAEKDTAHEEEIIGETFQYDYGENIYVVNFLDDKSLRWECVKGDELGKQATETYIMQHLGEKRFFISWIEADGLGVSQVLDLNDKTIHSFLKIEKSIIPLSGSVDQIDVAD